MTNGCFCLAGLLRARGGGLSLPGFSQRAYATTLHVQLRCEDRYFVLEVLDDGQAPAAPSRTGLGLRSMTARAKVLKHPQHGPPLRWQSGL